MSRSKTNTPTPIGRRSFLQGTGLTALGLPHLFAGGQSLQAAAIGGMEHQDTEWRTPRALSLAASSVFWPAPCVPGRDR